MYLTIIRFPVVTGKRTNVGSYRIKYKYIIAIMKDNNYIIIVIAVVCKAKKKSQDRGGGRG